jgi:hypothetical protein
MTISNDSFILIKLNTAERQLPEHDNLEFYHLLTEN